MVVIKLKNEEYEIACTEVLELLNYISKEDYNKVPKDVIQVLEKNKKNDMTFLYNPWKDINEQEMSAIGRLMLASFLEIIGQRQSKEKRLIAFRIIREK